jgi:hypothetical protein
MGLIRHARQPGSALGGGFEIVSCAGRARLYAERNNKTVIAGTNPAA